MLQVRFPIDQIIKAQFPDPTFTDRALVGAKPEPGRFFILPLSSSVTESQRSDPSDWHVGIIPFRAPSLSPEMLSCGLDATLGLSLSLSLLSQAPIKSQPNPAQADEAGINFHSMKTLMDLMMILIIL